jgi:predicted glycosyltransferase
MSPKPSLLFYCQHSLGIGHLVRSFALAEALAGDFRVTFLSGGALPASIGVPDGIDIVPLPPLGAGASFNLISRDQRFTVQSAKTRRREQILSCVASTSPDVIIVELFPLGRRKFADELVPMLDAATRREGDAPLVLCSLRDILVGRRNNKRAHDNWACETLNRYFDGVLVHADPSFSRLEETFKPDIPITVPLHYTGFVLPKRDDRRTEERTRQIVVSAGGGAVGGPLLRAAVEAQAILWPDEHLPMKVIAGPLFPEQEWRQLQRITRGREGLELLRSVPDVGVELCHAAASISQCGYNTAMDVLYAGVPALVVPFFAGQEDEQLNRSRRLAGLGALRVLEPAVLGGGVLADEIRKLMRFQPKITSLDLNGACNSARLVVQMMAARRRATANA